MDIQKLIDELTKIKEEYGDVEVKTTIFRKATGSPLLNEDFTDGTKTLPPRIAVSGSIEIIKDGWSKIIDY